MTDFRHLKVPKTLLALDPSTTCAGVAVFNLETKELVAAKYIKGKGFRGDLHNVIELAGEAAQFGVDYNAQALVSEWMQVYAKGPKVAHSLAPIYAMTGAVASFLQTEWWTAEKFPITLYEPRDWKGARKAVPTGRMVYDRLTVQEIYRVEEWQDADTALRDARHPDDFTHPTNNTLDAVGIGLHHLGRLKRKRVIAR